MSQAQSPPPSARPTERDPPDARERLQQMLGLLNTATARSSAA